MRGYTLRRIFGPAIHSFKKSCQIADPSLYIARQLAQTTILIARFRCPTPGTRRRPTAKSRPHQVDRPKSPKPNVKSGKSRLAGARLHAKPLYPYTVKVRLYRFRSGGQKLTKEERLKVRPVVGELRVWRRLYRGRSGMAQLLAPDLETYLVPVLDRADLVGINANGLMLTGYEVFPGRGAKSPGHSQRQTWWCEFEA